MVVDRPALAFPRLIEGPRLTLRPWDAGDVDELGILILDSIEHLRPFMAWVIAEPMAAEDRAVALAKWEHDFVSGTKDAVYGVFLGERPVGSCGLHRRGGPETLEIGYWIGSDHLRHGFAAEAAELLTDVAFRFDSINCVEIRHDAANFASGGVPKKLGFTHVGEADGPHVAPAQTGREWVWATTREAWASR